MTCISVWEVVCFHWRCIRKSYLHGWKCIPCKVSFILTIQGCYDCHFFRAREKAKGGVVTEESDSSCNFSSVQLLSCVRLFATPWIAAHQASLSITNSQSLPKPVSIESVMPSSHFILCCPLFPLLPIPPSIRVFSNESTLLMRCPKYWSFSLIISPSNEHSGLISFRMDWLDLLAVQGTLVTD